jgi:hypothetical protein
MKMLKCLAVTIKIELVSFFGVVSFSYHNWFGACVFSVFASRIWALSAQRGLRLSIVFLSVRFSSFVLGSNQGLGSMWGLSLYGA